MRATMLKHRDAPSLPPIHATISEGTNDVNIRISDQGKMFALSKPCWLICGGGGLWSPENQITSPADLFSFSHVKNASRMELSRLGALRTMSSSSEGMTATIGEQLSRWQKCAGHDDPEKEAGVGPHPRIGIGLPMSNIFAT